MWSDSTKSGHIGPDSLPLQQTCEKTTKSAKEKRKNKQNKTKRNKTNCPQIKIPDSFLYLSRRWNNLLPRQASLAPRCLCGMAVPGSHRLRWAGNLPGEKKLPYVSRTKVPIRQSNSSFLSRMAVLRRQSASRSKRGWSEITNRQLLVSKRWGSQKVGLPLNLMMFTPCIIAQVWAASVSYL